MESDGGDGACDGGTGDGRGTSVAHRESGSNEQVGSESRGSRWLRYAPSEARAFSALLSKLHRQITEREGSMSTDYDRAHHGTATCTFHTLSCHGTLQVTYYELFK